MKRPNRITHAAVAAFLLLAAASCNVDKYLHDGQRVLRKNSVSIAMADSTAVPAEIRAALADAPKYYHQKPNKKLLFFPLNRWIYCIPAPTDSTLWGKMWHNAGDPPVVYDRGAAARTAAQLETLLKTKGCFNSTVTVDTAHRRKTLVEVTYNITASPRKSVDEIAFYCRQPDIHSLLQQWKGESLIKVGDYYDQDLMTREQKRIVTNLKRQGYYYANDEMVHFLVDTTYDSRKMGILLMVRIPQDAEGRSGNNTLHRYFVGDIYVFPNVSTAPNAADSHFDTLVYPFRHLRGSSDLNFIYKDEIVPSPKAISQTLLIFPGMPYRPQIATNTSNALLGLHNFKFVDISFTESPRSSDTLRLLDARIRLLNSRRHRVSLSFELTNASDFGSSDGDNFITSGNLGLGTSVGYENNNTFGGAERFSLQGGLLLDFPKKVFFSEAATFYDIFSNFESDVTASLDLPKMLAPFAGNIVWQKSRPHTLVQLNYNYLFRSLRMPADGSAPNAPYNDIQLERLRLGASFGYTYTPRSNTKHTFLPFNLSFSKIISGDAYYLHLAELTRDIQFLYQIRDFVLLNTHYEYTYTNQDIARRKDFSYVHFSVETAGNLLNGAANLLGHGAAADADPLDQIEFSQYFRMDGEFKRYCYHGRGNTLVVRLLGGFALPYGQSEYVPYEKMFTGGGPTTMRGWTLRHLGPGQENQSHTDYALGVAPIQLVCNIEERFPLFGIFEGAVFADMGNVWEWRDWGVNTTRNSTDPAPDDCRFRPTEILKGVALDAGIGLRAKVSVITLRLDLAVPMYDPNCASGQRWISRRWDWNSLALNFGINYPF